MMFTESLVASEIMHKPDFLAFSRKFGIAPVQGFKLQKYILCLFSSFHGNLVTMVMLNNK